MKITGRITAALLAAACALTVNITAAAAFTDQSAFKVDSNVIDTLAEMNIINGFSDGTFKPDASVTRAQMAKMIYVLRFYTDDKATQFADTKTSFKDISSHWAANYIKSCVEVDIIAGRSSTVFDPDSQVTTAEAAKMLLVWEGYSPSKYGLTGADWQSNTMKLAKEYGLLDGVPTAASAALPRQYAAQMLYHTQRVQYYVENHKKDSSAAASAATATSGNVTVNITNADYEYKIKKLNVFYGSGTASSADQYSADGICTVEIQLDGMANWSGDFGLTVGGKDTSSLSTYNDFTVNQTKGSYSYDMMQTDLLYSEAQGDGMVFFIRADEGDKVVLDITVAKELASLS